MGILYGALGEGELTSTFGNAKWKFWEKHLLGKVRISLLNSEILVYELLVKYIYS